MDLALLRFIAYHFAQANMPAVCIFHCWPLPTQLYFAAQVTTQSFEHYIRYVPVDVPGNLEDFEWRYLRHKQPMLGIYLDMQCEQAERMMNLSSRLRLYNAHYNWLLYDATASLGQLQRLFGNANLSVDAQITYVARTGAVAFTLYDVFNNGRQLGGKLNVTSDREIRCSRQQCQLAQYLSDLHRRTKYGNRIVLADITMRVSTVITQRPTTLPEQDLQAFLYSENNTSIDSLVRYGFKLAMLKRDYFQCNFTFIYREGWSYGSETTGGIVGDLINDRADMGSSPFLVTASRLQYNSVLTETGGFRSVCIFRTPRNAGFQGGVFLAPFSSTVWLIFAVVLLVAAVLLWRTFRLEYYRLRYGVHFVPSLLAACLISFGSACSQGTFLVPASTGGRMIFFTLSLVTFIMYNYYTSAVVSSLLGSPLKSNIRTLAQLADSSLEVSLEPLPFTFVYLNTSQVPAVRRFVQRKIESRRDPQRVWQDLERGLLRVRDEPGFVFVFEASTGYVLVEKYYQPHEICDLNEVMLRPDKALHTQTHKNSTYKEFIRLRETRMLETGVINRFRRYWIRDHLNCFASNFVLNVGMEYAAPLFFMLLCAFSLALIVLLFEICYCKYGV